MGFVGGFWGRRVRGVMDDGRFGGLVCVDLVFYVYTYIERFFGTDRRDEWIMA